MYVHERMEKVTSDLKVTKLNDKYKKNSISKLDYVIELT